MTSQPIGSGSRGAVLLITFLSVRLLFLNFNFNENNVKLLTYLFRNNILEPKQKMDLNLVQESGNFMLFIHGQCKT